MSKPIEIAPAKGKLGILTPGMGAVATTFYAGVLSLRKGLCDPIGSLTQMGHIRLGKRTEDRQPLIREFVPLAHLDDLVFGGWDPISENAYEAAMTAGVLQEKDLLPIKDEMSEIVSMPAVFDKEWVKKLDGKNVKSGKTKMDLAEQLMADMGRVQEEAQLRSSGDRVVRLHRSVRGAERGSSDGAGLRGGTAQQRPAHQPQPDLRLRRHEEEGALRQRRAQSHHGRSGHHGDGHGESRTHRRQGLQDGPNPDEDHPRARFQGAHAGPERLVLHQHPGQPRR